MVEERILRNRRIENAKKHLADEGYLKSMEEYRRSESYRTLITCGVEAWKSRMEEVNPMFSVLANYENLDAEIFDSLCLDTDKFFTQTQSYNPPEEELRSVMKIAFYSLEADAEKIMEKYIKAFKNTSMIFEQIFLSEI